MPTSTPSTVRLLIHPVVPDAVPSDTPALLERLVDLGLIGGPFVVNGRQHWLAGARFVELITFLGCSPAIDISPPGGRSQLENGELSGFCHVSLLANHARPVLLSGRNTVAPRCRACNARFADWRSFALRRHDNGSSTPSECARCGSTLVPDTLNWRHNAGYARFFIEVWGIYPAEALPGEELLNALRQTTQEDWTYCYIQD